MVSVAWKLLFCRVLQVCIKFLPPPPPPPAPGEWMISKKKLGSFSKGEEKGKKNREKGKKGNKNRGMMDTKKGNGKQKKRILPLWFWETELFKLGLSKSMEQYTPLVSFELELAAKNWKPMHALKLVIYSCSSLVLNFTFNNKYKTIKKNEKKTRKNEKKTKKNDNVKAWKPCLEVSGEIVFKLCVELHLRKIK